MVVFLSCGLGWDAKYLYLTIGGVEIGRMLWNPT